MPTRPVILALVVAIAVVLASAWVLRPPPAPAGGPERVLDVQAAAITALRVTAGVPRPPPGQDAPPPGQDAPPQGQDAPPPGQDAPPPAAAAEVSLEGGRWLLRVGGGAPWPVLEERARAATRILADLEGRPLAPADAVPDGPPALELTITAAQRDPTTLRLWPAGPGGRRVVQLVGTPGAAAADAGGDSFTIDQPLAEALAPAALAAWRDRRPLAALPGRPSRIELATDAARLALARVGGRWSLTHPVAARADAAAVEALLGALAELRVDRFGVPAAGQGGTPHGRAGPAAAGERPVATITLEADATTPADDPAAPPERAVERLTIELFGAADTAGGRLRAAIARARLPRRPGAAWHELGRARVALNAAPLDDLPMHAQVYIARTALDGDASAVHALTLAGERFERAPDGWRPTPAPDAADPAPDSAADTDATLDALARLLSQRPADAVVEGTGLGLDGTRAGPVNLAAHALGGAPLAEAIALLVLTRPDGEDLVLLESEGVTRVHSDPDAARTARAAIALAAGGGK